MDAPSIAVQVFGKLVYAALGGIILWPFRALKAKVEEFTRQLKSVQTELVTQRTNCLTTLQHQGEQQIELLKEVSSTLSDMHLDQRSMMGKLDQ
jgi:hypothetical protein